VNHLHAWFLSRLLREKLLLLAFAGLGALIWLSSAYHDLSANLRSFRAAESELATQAVWLGNREAIEAAASAAARNLDGSKTYDATFLVAEVLGMAKRSGLSVVTEPPRTQRSAQFAVHTMQVSMRKVDLAAVIRFYQELASKAPYLGLEQISVQGDRSAPGMVNVTLQVTSVELLGDAAGRAAPAKPPAPAAAALAPAKPQAG